MLKESSNFPFGFGANSVFFRFERSGIPKNEKRYLRKIRKCSPWNGRRFAYTAPPPTRFGRLWPKILIRYFRPRCDQMGQIQKCWRGKSISLWNFTPVVHKVSLWDFLPILIALRPKIPIWYFRPGCDQKPCSVLSTVAQPFPYLSTFDQWCD